jgi:hypothetical protein
MSSILSVESKHQRGMNMHKEWTCIWCIRKLCGSALSMTSQLSKCEAHQHPYVKITKEVWKMTEFWMGYIVVKQQSDMHNKNSF